VRAGSEHSPSEASNNTYTNQGCRCAACTDAHRQYTLNRVRLLAQGRVLRDGVLIHPDAKHGTSTGYNHFSCRCRPCRDAFYLSCPNTTRWRKP
jgi:hypothetical protein